MRPHEFRDFRKALGLTQRKLGERLGLCRQQICRYEAGRSAIPLHTVKALDLIVARSRRDARKPKGEGE